MHDSDAAPAAIVHFTSLLMQVTAQGRAAVLERAPRLGVQVHPTSSPNKLIALLESANERATAQLADELLAIGGVLTVSVVSHLAEAASGLELEVGR